GVCHIFAICAAGDFENDGSNEFRSDQSAGKVKPLSNQRQRSASLHSWQGGTGQFYPDWPPGITCAFRTEPVKCAAAARPRPVVEGWRNCRSSSLGLGNLSGEPCLTGNARIPSLIALSTETATAFARSPADQTRADAERLSHMVLEM